MRPFDPPQADSGQGLEVRVVLVLVVVHRASTFPNLPINPSTNSGTASSSRSNDNPHSAIRNPQSLVLAYPPAGRITCAVATQFSRQLRSLWAGFGSRLR